MGFERDISGTRVPAFLYGTAWKEEDTERCVTDALAAGFRGIDTANQRKHYHEAGVGAALRKAFEGGRVARAELFIQTKFTYARGQDHRLPYDPKAPFAEQVKQSFARSLEHLPVGYLDSYVLHGPELNEGLTDGDWAVWRTMEAIHGEGGARLLGVSNVSAAQLRALVEGARVKPAFVQNRCYARLGWDREVREHCRHAGVVYQGFSLLTANPEVFRDPRFAAISKKAGLTPAQAVFRFALQAGMLPLTGTTDPAHMKEDLGALERGLEEGDVRAIEKMSG